MKKTIKIAMVAVVAAVAGVGGYMVQQQKANIDIASDVLSANIEALASGEGATPCGGPKFAGDCQSTNTVNCRDLSGCQ